MSRAGREPEMCEFVNVLVTGIRGILLVVWTKAQLEWVLEMIHREEVEKAEYGLLLRVFILMEAEN